MASFNRIKIIEFLAGYNFRKEISAIELALYGDYQKVNTKKIEGLLDKIGSNTYYGNLPEYIDINKYIDPISKLKSMPFLTKKILNNHEKDILFNPDRIKLEKIQTSGSSGIKGLTYLSHDEIMKNRSIQLLWWQWAGYKPGEKAIQLGVNINRNIPKAVKDYILNIDYHLAFGQSEQQIYDKLHKYRNSFVPFLAGYASSLYLYSVIAEKYKMNIEIGGCISWGDKLFDHFKEKIGRVFGCRTFDTYGSSEGFNIAGECQYGSLHVTTSHIYLEALDSSGRDVEAGQIGQAVVTRLDASHFPMIRYKIGDLVILQPESFRCECGRNTQVIQKVIGRDTDIIRFEGGYLTVQVIVYILKQIEGIIQWQVVQKNYNQLLLKLMVSGSYSEHSTNKILKLLNEAVHNKITITIEFTKDILNSGIGKPQLIISEIEK